MERGKLCMETDVDRVVVVSSIVAVIVVLALDDSADS